MDPGHFKKLILVDAAGIKPPVGEIFDMFLVVAKEFITESFLDPANTPEFATICPEEPTPEQAEYWEVAREQTATMVGDGQLDAAMLDAIGRKRPDDAEGLARWIKMYQALPESARDLILAGVPTYNEISQLSDKLALLS